jgi:RNA-directed DNA polymerase
VRTVTKRSRGVSLATVCEDLRVYLVGWRNYFQIAECRSILEDLDKWIRRRVRAFWLRQWRNPHRIYAQLRKLGLDPLRARQGAAYARRWWRASDMVVHMAMTNRRLDELGLPRLAA